MAPGNTIALISAASGVTGSTEEQQEIKDQLEIKDQHSPDAKEDEGMGEQHEIADSEEMTTRSADEAALSSPQNAVSPTNVKRMKMEEEMATEETTACEEQHQAAGETASAVNEATEATPCAPTEHREAKDDADDVEMKEEEIKDIVSKDEAAIVEAVVMDEVEPLAPTSLDEGAAVETKEEVKEEKVVDDATIVEAVVKEAVDDTAAAAEEKAAADAAAPAVEEEEAQCLICYDILSSKRAVMAVPCMHAMHRTCAVAWLESRTDGDAQFCASCRCGVEFIADMENGGELPEVIPYGNTGQPTTALIDDIHIYNHTELMELRQHSERTIMMISQIAEEQHAARVAGKGVDYLEDFDFESSKLLNRLVLLEDLEREFADRRHRQMEATHAAEAAQQAAILAQAQAAQAAYAQQQAQLAAAAAAAAAQEEADPVEAVVVDLIAAMVREEEAAAEQAAAAAPPPQEAAAAAVTAAAPAAMEQPAAEVPDIAREEELPEENEGNPGDIPLD